MHRLHHHGQCLKGRRGGQGDVQGVKVEVQVGNKTRPSGRLPVGVGVIAGGGDLELAALSNGVELCRVVRETAASRTRQESWLTNDRCEAQGICRKDCVYSSTLSSCMDPSTVYSSTFSLCIHLCLVLLCVYLNYVLMHTSLLFLVYSSHGCSHMRTSPLCTPLLRPPLLRGRLRCPVVSFTAPRLTPCCHLSVTCPL